MEESLPTEHGGKLFPNPLEQLLYSGGIANESRRHFQTARRYIADGRLDIVRDPFHKIRAVLVLDIQQLFVHLLHGHTAAKDAGHRKIAAVGGIAGSHHIFGIEHLLGELWDSERSEQVGACFQDWSQLGQKKSMQGTVAVQILSEKSTGLSINAKVSVYIQT